MKLYFDEGGIRIYHGDCRDVLPTLTESVALLLTDPPYGSSTRVDSKRFATKSGDWWSNPDRSVVGDFEPVEGDDEPFDPRHLVVAKKTILWGAQWYASRLRDRGGWLVWDKRRGIEDVEWPLSEAELAWRSWGDGVRIFRHRWFGLIRDSEKGYHVHPTQKPVTLMEWCIRLAKPDGLVLDPYMGSGPTLEAAKRAGLRAIGIELKEKYCEVAARRLSQGCLGLS